MSKVLLLVDDDDAFREIVKTTLEMEDYQVLAANGGKAAMAILKKESVDLVITDILMPDTDGIELISQIKENNSSLKVIGMTGGGRIAEAKKLEESFSGFYFEKILIKPFESEDLLAEIEKALK